MWVAVSYVLLLISAVVPTPIPDEIDHAVSSSEAEHDEPEIQLYDVNDTADMSHDHEESEQFKPNESEESGELESDSTSKSSEEENSPSRKEYAIDLKFYVKIYPTFYHVYAKSPPYPQYKVPFFSGKGTPSLYPFRSNRYSPW